MIAKDEELNELLVELTAIREEMVADPSDSSGLLDRVHPNYGDSARNLLHYLALRRHDLRPLQFRLAALGLSSLGRAESHVMATVDAVLEALQRLANRPWEPGTDPQAEVDFATGQRLLVQHSETLLGPADPGRGVQIMVTMPSEAAWQYTLVHDLLQQGMNCMRINCAHDDADAWTAMTENLRRAERALGKSCRVTMDLAGPKLRTGPLEPGAMVVRIRPRRDEFGKVVGPARIWLTAGDRACEPPTAAAAALPVPADWLAELRVGDRLRLIDARGSARVLDVVDVTPDGCWAEANQTAYLVPGTLLSHEPQGADDTTGTAPVGTLTPREGSLLLQPGDILNVTRDQTPGRPASHDSEGEVLTPASIGCTLPEVFEQVRAGEPIWFDDGKIGGVIERVEPSRVRVRITYTRLGGGKLQADKGINLPESELQLPAMTPKDVEDLAVAARLADVVALSFANTARDVELLQEHLTELGGPLPAIVLKIETRRGFENLPDMLLTAMRWPSCGVMIARGDLAVECGFERLAEVQEEMLWICEAAHIPVIWATQVLETLAKEGMPSRAEITDAAMGHRAECVMLNKGPHVVSAVRMLDDILHRMQAHQTKKRAMLRELKLAHWIPGPENATLPQP